MKAVICDGRISPAMERGLLKHGYFVIKLPAHTALPKAISAHPDTLIFNLGDTYVSSCEYGELAAYIFSDIREFSSQAKLFFVDENMGDKYPSDAIFNAVSFGKYLIANEKTISKKVLEIAKKQGLIIKNVNQGYPNCSILKLNEENAITADEGIYRALCEINVNTLLIEPGSISLPPYSYGFIGGASGVDDDKVFFLGDLNSHPNKEKMQDFINDLGMKIISLSDESLTDLGGLMFI